MTPKKKRSLPAWMKDPTNSPSTSQFVSTTPAVTVPETDRPEPVSTVSQITDTLSDEETNEILDEEPRTSKDLSDTHMKHGLVNRDNHSNNLRRGDSPQNNDAQENQDDDKSSSSAYNLSVSPDRTNVASGTMPIVVNGTKSPATRRSCIYGSSCYRKNPQHRADFAHPGDPDFSDPAGTASPSSPNDNRPLCEYGTACYRKNPQHRRDYRHDAPQKRKARPSDLQDIPSDNEGDFDASFDSDNYKPGDSESDDSFVTSDSVGSGDSDFDPEDDEENKKKAAKRKKKTKQNNKKRAKKD